MQYRHFSIEEREKIQLGLWEKKSLRTLAKELGRSPSSVSREIKRNYPFQVKRYTPRLAHQKALYKRSQRGRIEHLKNNRIRDYVIYHLKLRWSPEQIANNIYKDIEERISYEAIYQYIYYQFYHNGYGYIKPGREDLRFYLRRRRKRRMRQGFRKSQRLSVSVGNSIDNRLSIVEKRKRLGDWESDTVESCDHKPGINTLVDRKSGFVLISKLKNKTSEATMEIIEKRIIDMPKHTITFDNGSENQKWKRLDRTGVDCYFAHPYHSWERGTNENTNGLIRDFFPKKTDFSTISKEEIQQVEYLLNTRPRKRLGWKTPQEVMGVALQS